MRRSPLTTALKVSTSAFLLFLSGCQVGFMPFNESSESTGTEARTAGVSPIATAFTIVTPYWKKVSDVAQLPAAVCSEIQVVAVSEVKNNGEIDPIPVLGNTKIKFAGLGSSSLFRDSNCTNPVDKEEEVYTEIMPAGIDRLTLYVKNPSITASSTILQVTSRGYKEAKLKFQSVIANKWGLTPELQDHYVGNCKEYTLTLHDIATGQPTTDLFPRTGARVTLTRGSASPVQVAGELFSSLSECESQIFNSGKTDITLDLPTGAQSIKFAIRLSKPEVVENDLLTLQATAAGVASGTATVRARLKRWGVAPSGEEHYVGSCKEYSLTLLDATGKPAADNINRTGISVNALMIPNLVTGEFFANVDACELGAFDSGPNTITLSLPKGETEVRFAFRPSKSVVQDNSVITMSATSASTLPGTATIIGKWKRWSLTPTNQDHYFGSCKEYTLNMFDAAGNATTDSVARTGIPITALTAASQISGEFFSSLAVCEQAAFGSGATSGSVTMPAGASSVRFAFRPSQPVVTDNMQLTMRATYGSILPASAIIIARLKRWGLAPVGQDHYVGSCKQYTLTLQNVLGQAMPDSIARTAVVISLTRNATGQVAGEFFPTLLACNQTTFNTGPSAGSLNLPAGTSTVSFAVRLSKPEIVDLDQLTIQAPAVTGTLLGSTSIRARLRRFRISPDNQEQYVGNCKEYTLDLLDSGTVLSPDTIPRSLINLTATRSGVAIGEFFASKNACDQATFDSGASTGSISIPAGASTATFGFRPSKSPIQDGDILTLQASFASTLAGSAVVRARLDVRKIQVETAPMSGGVTPSPRNWVCNGPYRASLASANSVAMGGTVVLAPAAAGIDSYYTDSACTAALAPTPGGQVELAVLPAGSTFFLRRKSSVATTLDLTARLRDPNSIGQNPIGSLSLSFENALSADGRFGGTGDRASSFCGSSIKIKGMALDSSGRTIVTGSCDGQLYVGRYSIDGQTLDNFFLSSLPLGETSEGRAVVVDPISSHIYVAGVADGTDALEDILLVKLDPAMNLVGFPVRYEYDTDTVNNIHSQESASSIALYSTDRLLVGGSISSTREAAVLSLRRTDLGLPIPTRFKYDSAAATNEVRSVLVNGSVAYLAGTSDGRFALARLIPTLTASVINPNALGVDVRGAALQDGKVVLVGTTSGNNVGLARFNADGTVDTAFSSGGFREITTSATETVGGIAVYPKFLNFHPDSLKIVISGIRVSGGNRTFFIQRHLPNGERDPSDYPADQQIEFSLPAPSSSGTAGAAMLMDGQNKDSVMYGVGDDGSRTSIIMRAGR